MRLPSYSHLLALPAGPDFLFRLLETIVVAGCALAAHRLFESDANAHHGHAVAALTILLGWSTLSAFYVRPLTRRPSALRNVLAPALAWIVYEAAAVGIVKWMHAEYVPSSDALVCMAAMTAASVMLCRVVAEPRARSRAVVVVGSGERGANFVRRITATRDEACRIEAFFDVDSGSGARAESVPLFHDIDAFATYVRTNRIDEVWLALPITDERTLQRFLDLFRHDLVTIRFIPDVRQVARFHGEHVDLDGALAINLVGAPPSRDAVIGKVLFDFAFSFCAVVALAPVLIAVALAVKLTSRGPVLFTQRRRGANGRPFSIYKFRTMRVHTSDGGTVAQATRGDPRVTRVGAILRRTSLDELPQFFNVLRGEMSVVGPRPHAIEHDAQYQHIVDDYIHRYRIKPGITGWAQINGLRGETDSINKMQRRVEHDLYYLSNWSFALDMRIVLATVVRGFVHRNAY